MAYFVANEVVGYRYREAILLFRCFPVYPILTRMEVDSKSIPPISQNGFRTL
jgi:hypothetical protein